MPRKRVLPTIDAVYNDEGVTFYCEGEPIEDMEFSWEDLTDAELCSEVAEELVEYIDSDELEDLDNPVATVLRALRQIRKLRSARKRASEADDDEGEPDDEYDEDE